MSDNWHHSTGQKIDKLYAWIATEADGGEGVISHTFPDFGTLPLIGADMERMESIRPLAQAIATRMRLTVKLKVFGTGVVIDEVTP